LDSLAEGIFGQGEGPIVGASSPIPAQIRALFVREVSFLKSRTCHPEAVVVIYAPDDPDRHRGAAKDGAMHEF